MTPEVAKAQVAALLDWAHEWTQLAITNPGAAEVGYLMRRTAREIQRALGVTIPEEEEILPQSVNRDTLRDG